MDAFNGKVILDFANILTKGLANRVRGACSDKAIKVEKAEFYVKVQEGGKAEYVNLKMFLPTMNIVFDGKVT